MRRKVIERAGKLSADVRMTHFTGTFIHNHDENYNQFLKAIRKFFLF